VTQCYKRPMGRSAALLLVVAMAVGLAASGCGSDGSQPKDVVLVTHDSFAVSKDVKQAFEKDTGLQLRILQGGDANETLNKALLTAGDPQGDVIFGIDDSILSRALDGDLLDEYRSPELAALEPDFSDPDSHVTPIDHGEVCLNVDRGWFAERGLAPPERPVPAGRAAARNTAIFAVLTGLSRIAGLAREIIASSYFATSGAFSAFTIAFQGRFALGALVGGAAAYVWIATISGMIRIATMFAILIIGLIAGPAVSL